MRSLSTTLGLILLSVVANAQPTPVAGSRYTYKPLTPEQCNTYVLKAIELGVDRMTKPGLNEAMDVLAAECGLGADPEKLSSQTRLWVVEGSNFAILSDGQKVSFGDSALAAKELGLISANHVQVITEAELQATLKPVVEENEDQSEQKAQLPQFAKPRTTGADAKPEVKSEARTEERIAAQVAAAGPAPKVGFVAKINARLNEIYDDGREVVYFSGLAYHDRRTYTKDKVRELNEKAWGIGYGRERINDSGNYESLSVMAFADSHNDASYNLAYFWQKLFRIGHGTSVGAGFTAGLTSRSDILHHIPVPYAFPAFSLNVGKFSMMSVFIPKLNGGINHGNVVFVFIKMPLDSVTFTNLQR